MATLTIRNFDDALARRLSVRAAKNGVSREEEVRRILAAVLGPEDAEIWAALDAARARTRPQKTDSTDLVRQDRDSRR